MGEKLYNNIELPDEWPPKYSVEELNEGQPIPYLKDPPKVIDITVGRQLFVDDFLLDGHNLYPKYHRAVKYPGNPVLFPETDMEKFERLPGAAPKDGGVWYDRDEKKYKMWYEAGWLHKMAYAESEDGIHWERPNLHIVEGTNEILPDRQTVSPDGNPVYLRPDSTSVVIDYDTDKADERYKLFIRNPGFTRPGIVGVSGDGIHFSKFRYTEMQGDRSTMFYNPFRKKWVQSIRSCFNLDRTRDYFECDDLIAEAKWGDRSVNWLCADNHMKPNPYLRCKPQLYNFNAIAYESIMLGFFEVLYGPQNGDCFDTGAPKITELIPVYSRDGFHFYKPSNQAFVQAAMIEGAWDRGYVQSVGGGCIVLKDEIRIYYCGFEGDESRAGEGNPNDCQFHSFYANFATGFATLRRDGFVSLGVEEDGMIYTKALTFRGKKKYLFVNAKTKPEGCVKVTVTDTKREKIYAESAAFVGDSTCAMLDFGDFDFTQLEGKEFKLTFYIGQGEIYSFWLSESEDGESGGYDGAGGPKD